MRDDIKLNNKVCECQVRYRGETHNILNVSRSSESLAEKETVGEKFPRWAMWEIYHHGCCRSTPLFALHADCYETAATDCRGQAEAHYAYPSFTPRLLCIGKPTNVSAI